MKRSIVVGHRAARESAYMPVGDQLDAIIKTFAHLEAQGIDIGQDGRELVKQSKEVKATFKKVPSE